MDILLAAALAACVENNEVCTIQDRSIHVCDVAPEEEGAPISFVAQLPSGIYTITLEPKCESI